MTWQQVKIVDFGFARLVPEKDAELKVICGTPEFMAPEVLNFDPVCFKSDIWWVMKCKRAFNFSGAERHKQAHETARVCTFLKMGQTRPRFAYFVLSEIIGQYADWSIWSLLYYVYRMQLSDIAKRT